MKITFFFNGVACIHVNIKRKAANSLPGRMHLIINAPSEPQRLKMYFLTPNQDSDQSAHSRSLIRVFVVHMKKLCAALKLGYPNCAQWRFWSDCANAQTDLNLRWANMPGCPFPDVAVKMVFCLDTDKVPANCIQLNLNLTIGALSNGCR